MPDPSKDFTPIRDDYEFFATHSTESEYRPRRLRRTSPVVLPARRADPHARLRLRPRLRSRAASWSGPLGRQDRLDLALVEPSAGVSPAGRRAARGHDRPPRPCLNASFRSAMVRRVRSDPRPTMSSTYVPQLETALGRIVRVLDPDGLFLTAIADRDNFLIDLWFRVLSTASATHALPDLRGRGIGP